MKKQQLRKELNLMFQQITPKRHVLPMNNQYSFLRNRTPRCQPSDSSLTKLEDQLNQKAQFRLPRIARNQYSDRIQTLSTQLKGIKELLIESSQEKKIQSQISRKITEMGLASRQTPFMPFPVPMYYPPYPPGQNYTPQNISNHCAKCQKHDQTTVLSPPQQQRLSERRLPTKLSTSHETKSDISKTQIAKKPQLKGRPKLRKYVIAVCFALYFPNFAERFTKNRYKHFKQNYLVNGGIRVVQGSHLIRSTLVKSIDVPQIILEFKNKKRSMHEQRAKSIKKGKLRKTQRSVKSDKDKKQVKKATIKEEVEIEDFFIETVINLLDSYMSELYAIVTSKKFLSNFYQILSIGTLNCSFLMDHLVMVQQLEILKFHLVKGYMVAGGYKEQLLLMNLLLIKIVVGNIFFNKEQKNQWHSSGQISEAEWEMVNDVIQAAGTFLYLTCQEIFAEFEDNDGPKNSLIYVASKSMTKCVYENLKPKFKVQPARPIYADKLSGQKHPDSSKKEFIIGIPHLEQMQRIYKYDDNIQNFKPQMKEKIINLVQEVHSKLRNQPHLAFYDQIKEQTLLQKNLIKNGNPRWLFCQSQAPTRQQQYNFKKFMTETGQQEQVGREIRANLSASRGSISRLAPLQQQQISRFSNLIPSSYEVKRSEEQTLQNSKSNAVVSDFDEGHNKFGNIQNYMRRQSSDQRIKKIKKRMQKVKKHAHV